MSADLHRQRAAGDAVRCAVVTVSDTRTRETDASGALLAETLRDAGHAIVAREIVRDEPEAIREALLRLARLADAVVTTGGTGIALRDRTVEVAEALIRTPLPGFGELFRMLSYREVGAAAMLSRATAGLYGPDGATVLFCCPGSVNAVAVAAEALVAPELAHVVREVRRQRG